MRRVLTVILGIVLTLSYTLPLSAADLAGVKMADDTKAGDKPLVLNGLGLRKKAVFKVYVGGLYLESKSSDAGKIMGDDEVRHMEMHFLRNLSSKQLCGGWDDGLEANTPVAVKGAAKGTVAGKEYADALLACWLGPEPPSSDFKAGLLGE